MKAERREAFFDVAGWLKAVKTCGTNELIWLANKYHHWGMCLNPGE